MAIFEIKSESNKSVDKLYQKINYICNSASTRYDLIYGAAVNKKYPFEDMMMAKNIFNQVDRNAYYHYVLSLSSDDHISESRFYYLCIEVCELLSTFCGNYQVLMAVHIDTDHLHAHYVANNIDYLSGSRMNLDLEKLYELKRSINSILEKYDVSLIAIHSN